MALPVVRCLTVGRGRVTGASAPNPQPGSAETSPYFPDLTLRQYEIVEIRGVVLTVGYWRSDTPDLVLRPAVYAPGLLTVVASNPAGHSGRVSQRFPTTGLQLFKRTDQFTRELG